MVNLIDPHLLPSGEVSCQSSARFGEKIALSDNGKSMAVAAPEIEIEPSHLGAVFVYVLVDRSWQQLESVLYGKSTLRRIGSSGVAIDDEVGRIDIREYSGRHRSFKVCSEYATFTRIPSKTIASKQAYTDSYFVVQSSMRRSLCKIIWNRNECISSQV